MGRHRRGTAEKVELCLFPVAFKAYNPLTLGPRRHSVGPGGTWKGQRRHGASAPFFLFRRPRFLDPTGGYSREVVCRFKGRVFFFCLPRKGTYAPRKTQNFMNIHEHQAKDLFREHGLPVQDGIVAYTVEEAVAAYEKFGDVVAVKAQVHTGGRGLAGGVKIAKTVDEVREHAGNILGLDIKGHIVKRLYIEDGCSSIEKEAYLAVILDRSAKAIGFIGSAEGGVEIETVAHENPDAIKRFSTSELTFPKDAARPLAEALFGGKSVDETMEVLEKLFDMFVKLDCTQAEINPLVLTGDGSVLCLDGKLNFDDNALFRHPEIVKLRDMEEEDVNEIEAKEKGLAFIQLDGDIGCMVNGAGLAMATLDMINIHGGKPANFLDVGGSSNPDKVVEAFKLILASGKVKSILVNIFGGITRCTDIAEGMLTALKQMDVEVPIVVRLEGTEAEAGRKMLADSPLHTAETFGEAVAKAVKLGKGEAA